MKKHDFGKPLCRLIMAVAMMMLSLQAMAYDFSHTYQGKTLYYKILASGTNTLAVTYYSETAASNNHVSGDVVIPSSVEYNGTTYSVTSIGYDAFKYCSSLTSVTIPNSVTSIGDYAFYGCSGLTSINVASGNTHYSSIDGVLYNYTQNTLIQCPGAKTSITIPTGVTSIRNSAFSGCSGLTSVTIPNSVTSIGDYAFRNCSGLTTLNFNAINCQDFGPYNYNYYPFGTSLTTVNIGDSVQRIPANFVRGCSGLTSVSIPNSVTSIGDCAFSWCSGLTSVSIPNSVTSIGDYAFFDCSGLTSVTIPNSVTSIGEQAFYNCSGLTSVSIPNSVTSIGDYAFFGCSGLTSINVASGNTHYSSIDGVLYNYVQDTLMQCPCAKTSVTIPTGVTSIRNFAFSGCSGLTTLNFNAINCQDFEEYYNYYPFSGTSLTTVNIGDSVQRIPANFVRDCSGLTSVTIGNSVTSIGVGAFHGCSGLTTLNFNAINCQDFNYCPFSGTSLTTVNIGDSVQRIPAYFVKGCSGLTSVTIGNSLTSIAAGAFNGCTNLSSLVSLATVPPTIGNEAFPYPNICTVTVPCGSLAAYTASTCYWSVYFPQRITESSSFELSVSVNEEAYGRVEVETQSCNVKTLTAIANEGYEFTGWNDGNTENPRTVTITSDTTFMAIFAETETTPTITVTVNDATMGSATYTMDGNTAVLTATANEGYSFLTWSDGNTENPRTVNLTSDTAFVAIFTEAVSTPTITVTVNDATMGSATYTMDGNTAVLTATPNEGYEFTGWNDGNTENPRTVTITSDTAFTAIFTEAVSTPTITVTVNDATMGSATYTMDGNTAVLTATPNEGYEFTGWNDGNTENPRTVTITSDTTFMAIFSPASSLQEVNAREFALYPNPAKSFVTLEFEALKENTLLQILDINGRRVRTFDLKAGQETLRIDLGDLPKGVYTVMLGNTTKKLIVE